MSSASASTPNGRNGVVVTRHTAAEPPADQSRIHASLNIALAANEPAKCQEWGEMLSRLGHRLCAAQTTRQLVDQCRLLRPDLIIATLPLLDLNGFSATDEICRNFLTPFIVLADDSDAPLVQRALDNPCVLACLVLPIKETELRLAISLAVRRYQQFECLRREAAELRQTLEERKLVERAKGVVMRYVGLDEEEAYRRLRKMSSDQNRKLPDVAQAILQAGEVFHALQCSGEGKRLNDGPSRVLNRPHRNGSNDILHERKVSHTGKTIDSASVGQSVSPD